jgi:cytochrome c biogenesis protein CcmG/thiol:disulfide interchange protein DsbE
LTVALGIVAGLLAGAVGWAALVAFGPTAPPPSTPPPSLSLPTEPPSPGISPSQSARAASPSASGSATAPGASASAAALFGVGSPAPALRVPQLGGGTIDLAALRGKPVWLNFMATWCPPCRDELPLMGSFAARYQDRGLVVAAIDVKEDESIVAPYMASVGASFPVGLDTDGSAQTRWRAAALPVHYWIDAQGIVRDGAFGGIGPDVMAAGLRTVLPGVDVEP